MSFHTHVVVNENARQLLRRPELIERIEQAASGSPVHVTRTLENLDEVALAIAERDAQRVVLCGGDGTYMAGVTALRRAFADRQLPELVLAPAGTVATVARNWGQRRGVVDTVRRAVERREQRVTERPSLLVSDASGERVGFIFGTGLVARFFDRYYTMGAGGYPAAARIVARVFWGSFRNDAYAKSVLEPLPCDLRVDGRSLPHDGYSLIVVSVVRDLGLHLLVTYRAGVDAQRPHLVACAQPTRELGPQAPRVLLGRPLRGPGVYDGLVGEACVTFADADGGPWVLDGDVFHSKAVTVSAGPRLRVVAF
jgi:diacylglycerol kinase (ATP)